MPLSPFQKQILKTLAAQRTEHSYIAGGSPIAAQSGRFSIDFDIFHDNAELVRTTAEADEKALLEAGFKLEWTRQGQGMWEGFVQGEPDPLKLQWAQDSAFRFFPAQRDTDFGFVLHPADLIINKALTIADRREARDVFDIAFLSNFIPIAAAIIAAPEKDPGYNPESLIGAIRRNLAHPQAAFDNLLSSEPIDGSRILQRLRLELEEAEEIARRMPTHAIGKLYIKNDRIVTPNPDELELYNTVEASNYNIVPQVQPLSPSMIARLYGKNGRGR